MSLLLEARKKMELSLESNAPPTPFASSVEASARKPVSPSPSPLDEFSLSPNRATGENLFAAKVTKSSKPTRRLPKLGIVPLTFLICSVLGAMYGAYLWYELSYLPDHASRTPLASPNIIAPASPTPAAPAIAPPASPLIPAVEATPTPSSSPVPLASTEKNIPPTPRAQRQTRPIHRAANAVPPASASRVDTASQGIFIEHKMDFSSVDPALLAAYQAYQAGDFSLAEQQYQAVLRKDAQSKNTPNRDALLGLAAVAQQRSQDSLAAQYYAQVLQQDPRDPLAVAGMLALRGAVDGTDSRVKNLLAQHPDSAALHFALGNQYADQSRWSEAQQSYFNAYSLAPDNAQFAFNLAISLDHLGQRKLATQHYQRALQLDGRTHSFDHPQTEQRLRDLTAP
jgi:Flp pilus assembly protein TadD